MEDGSQRPTPEFQVNDLRELASKIQTASQDVDVAAVAIAGPPGSGKSSIAGALCEIIGETCCVVPMDGFHLDNDILAARGLLQVKGAPETFDLAGFAGLVSDLKSGATRHFPTFDRDADSVVADGGMVPAGVSILLFEGNYLLFDEDGWMDLADQWDASLWLDVPEDVLAQRLTQRWLDQGMTKQDAVARAEGNDIPNARRVLKRARPATWSLLNVRSQP